VLKADKMFSVGCLPCRVDGRVKPGHDAEENNASLPNRFSPFEGESELWAAFIPNSNI
jgi:hypothetical protein